MKVLYSFFFVIIFMPSLLLAQSDSTNATGKKQDEEITSALEMVNDVIIDVTPVYFAQPVFAVNDMPFGFGMGATIHQWNLLSYSIKYNQSYHGYLAWNLGFSRDAPPQRTLEVTGDMHLASVLKRARRNAGFLGWLGQKDNYIVTNAPIAQYYAFRSGLRHRRNSVDWTVLDFDYLRSTYGLQLDVMQSTFKAHTTELILGVSRLEKMFLIRDEKAGKTKQFSRIIQFGGDVFINIYKGMEPAPMGTTLIDVIDDDQAYPFKPLGFRIYNTASYWYSPNWGIGYRLEAGTKTGYDSHLDLNGFKKVYYLLQVNLSFGKPVLN